MEHEWVVAVVDFSVTAEVTGMVSFFASVDILVVDAVVCFSVTLPGSSDVVNVGAELPASEMYPVLLFSVGSWV